jgi:hypothetical protein
MYREDTNTDFKIVDASSTDTLKLKIQNSEFLSVKFSLSQEKSNEHIDKRKIEGSVEYRF